MNLFVFTPKYWAFAFAGLPFVVWRFMPFSFKGLLGPKEDERDAKLARLGDALVAAGDDKRRLADELAQRTTALDDRTKSLQRERDDNAALRQSLQREQDDNAALRQSLRRADDDRDAARAHSQKLAAELAQLRRQLDGKDAELRTTQHDLRQTRTKHDELTTLLDTRTRELRGAQAFLTKADALSGAEVIALVDALNVEILQTAAFIADSFDFARPLAHPDDVSEASARIGELMGPTLTRLLGAVLHSEDPLLVQIALQGATVEFSRWIIMTWDFDGLQAEQPLAEIYNDVRESETQAVGGRWRALTRAHAQKVALQEADLHGTMVTHISDTLVIILVAAGCTRNYEDAYRTFTQKFGERVSNIVKMASRLNKAMGEEVTSADLWPLNATAGDTFDKAVMESFESNDDDADGKAVLCTTALGLQRSEKVVQGETVEFKNTTLLRPKVALESVADALDRDDA